MFIPYSNAYAYGFKELLDVLNLRIRMHKRLSKVNKTRQSHLFMFDEEKGQ